MFTEVNITKKPKPARIQVPPDEFEEELPPQDGTVFNIWYNKWSGGGTQFTLTKSKYKLNVDKDTGYTRADKLPRPYFCLFFAKGMCCKGKKCEYLHRIPQDEDVFQSTVDCFGREKFADYRDDMSGIGSFNSVNKTLYIGGLVIKGDTQELLNSEFRKLGKIQKINVINDKNCGFVVFKNEVNAQFAKEAMMGQSLYGTDILNVKWAHEDPNPAAMKLKKRQLELETQDVVKGLLEKYEIKRQRGNDEEEPTVEEPEEQEEQEAPAAPAAPEVKQIEEPKTGILKDSSLEYLNLLKAYYPTITEKKPLISGYESSSDEE